jgi:hypothetical protein
MLIPFAPTQLSRRAPIPRAVAVRYARRVQAARRWGRGSLPSEARPPAPPSVTPEALTASHSLSLAPEAATHLVELLRSAHGLGWIDSSSIASLIGADPSLAYAALLDAVNAQITERIAPLESLLGSAKPDHVFVAFAPSITHQIGCRVFGSEIHVELLQAPVIAFPDLPERETIALIHAWNRLSKESPLVCRVEHTSDAYAGWEIESFRDASSEGEWKDGVFCLAPSAIADHAEERGEDPEDYANRVVEFVHQERDLARMLKKRTPNARTLRSDVRAVIRDLDAIAAFCAQCGQYPSVDEGPYTPVALAPPNDIHSTFIEYGLDCLGQDSATQSLQVENPDQLLGELVNVNLHLAAAHAAFSKVLTLHVARPRPDR